MSALEQQKLVLLEKIKNLNDVNIDLDEKFKIESNNLIDITNKQQESESILLKLEYTLQQKPE